LGLDGPIVLMESPYCSWFVQACLYCCLMARPCYVLSPPIERWQEMVCFGLRKCCLKMAHIALIIVDNMHIALGHQF